MATTMQNEKLKRGRGRPKSQIHGEMLWVPSALIPSVKAMLSGHRATRLQVDAATLRASDTRNTRVDRA